MKALAKPLKYLLVPFVAATFFACFSITVNVYFPEKDVKSAFKTLEQELMKGTPEEPAAPAPEGTSPEGAAPGPQGGLKFELGVASAYAADVEEQSAELVQKLKADASVVAAYKRMGGRLGYIDRLRDQGVLGEGSDGLLRPRAEVGKKESSAMDEENSDRRTIIRAMAKAIVEINNQPVNDDTISQVLDKAASSFADIRRGAARKGWWIQKPDGGWVQK